MRIDIKHRYTSAVLYTTEVADDDSRPMRTALERCVRAGRDPALLHTERSGLISDIGDLEGRLQDGPSGDEDEVRAERAHRQLLVESIDIELATPSARAYLAGANLAGANLARAYLAGANLAGANLASANLASAYLASAYLAGADHLPSGVIANDPPEPYVRAAPGPEALAERARRYRERHPEVPVVEHLDAKILAAVTTEGGSLEMADWHTCDTTHCRGGWSVNLAGAAGRKLEQKYGTHHAAAMIYRASTGRVPWFFDSNEGALADIRSCAENTAAAPAGDSTASI